MAADRAYDADALLGFIQKHGAQAVIPPKANRPIQRPYGRRHYKRRNLVERFVARIKQFHGISTRNQKLATCFKAFILVAASVVLLA